MFNKKSIGFLSCIIALTCASIAHADYFQQGATQDTTTMRQMQNGSMQNGRVRMSDQQLAQEVRDEIKAGWFSKGYDQVSIEVNNGVVAIKGSVPTWSDKAKLEKQIRNIDGVITLNSQLIVQEPMSKSTMKDMHKFAQDTYATSADDQLNKKIRDNVSSGWVWDSYKDVSLNTANGVVTLKGTVASMDDQKKLMDGIQKIDGVKSVKSELMMSDRS